MRKLLLKLLQAKQRNEIRDGKLWKVTRIWGVDLSESEQEPAKAAPFIKPATGTVDKMRVHVIKDENNVTNLTKKPELL